MDNVPKIRGTSAAYKPNKGGEIDIPYPVVGIVKDTIDSARTGRIRVYISDFGGQNPDDSTNWIPVSVMSPFYGITQGDSVNKTSFGTYTENSHSYGFWSQPPDINSEVVCVFINAKRNRGFYIGSIPRPGMTHMVPAVGASPVIVPNATEAEGYGGATTLPVTEFNDSNTKLSESVAFFNEPRPIHSFVAGQLFQQGLIRDPIRGTVTSSAMRESPSRVFGISTPGRPIYKGGLTGTEPEVASRITNATSQELKIIGRRGGHSFVMDDGDIQGRNQMVRLRTSTGHQITLSDDGQTLFIVHANGQSYVELGKEGTIDLYATNSVNIRTQGDLNFHADNNINLNAKKALNIYGEQININSDADTNIRVGTEFSQHTLGDHTVKVEKAMSIDSKGDASLASSKTTFINGGPTINLNTGSTALKPKEVKPIGITAHPDTLFDKVKGWITAPALLTSITSRAPAHSPWINSNLGVDVKVNSNASSTLPAEPSTAISNINNSVDPAPDNPTTPTLAATVPTGDAVSAFIDKNTTNALVSQSAVTAATDPKIAAAIKGTGIVTDLAGTKMAVLGALGHTPAQLEQAGILKPGAADLVNSLTNGGATLAKAIPSNLFTGKDNINNVEQFLGSPKVQVGAQVTLMQQGLGQLQSAGIITGKESPAQIAGLVTSTATHGIAATAAFVNSVSSNITSLPGVQGGLGALSPSMLKSPIANTISAGNFAAGMADKVTGAAGKLLGSLKSGATAVADQVKGAAASAFAAVKSTMVALKAGVEQNLTTIKAEAEAAKAKAAATTLPGVQGSAGQLGGDLAASAKNKIAPFTLKDAAGAVGSAISGTVKSVVGGVTGAVSTVGNLIDKAKQGSALGTANPVTTAAQTAMANLNNTSGVNLNLSALKQNPNLGLDALAAAGMDASQLANLNNSVASLSSGSAATIKLPTLAINTVDRGEMNAQAALLLGPGIPLPITAGGTANIKPPSPELQKQYSTLKKELNIKQDVKWDLSKAVYKAQKAYGPDSADAVEAEAQYKQCLARIQEIQTEMGDITKQMLA
jgi:hypothetical protein